MECFSLGQTIPQNCPFLSVGESWPPSNTRLLGPMWVSHPNHIWIGSDKLVCFARCCACRHRHMEVWPRPGSDTARQTSLARRPRPGVFQAGSDSSPVSERPHTAVPVGLLYSGRRCRHSAAPAFRQLFTRAVPNTGISLFGRIPNS